MKTRHIFSRIVVPSLLLVSTIAYGGRPGDAKPGTHPASTTVSDVYRPILINNIFNYYSNNGDGSYNARSTNNEGFEFPKGGTLTTIYEEGLVWGVKQRDTIKVGGSVYRHGLQAGPIMVSGTPTSVPVADDPTNPMHRVYRVRRDCRPIPGVTDPNDPQAGTQRRILQDEEVGLVGRYEAVTAVQLLQQYWDDWNEWPASLGAPYTDVDHNRAYDPAVDIPGPPMADQALWYVANDLSRVRVQNLAGSDPIGLEMQRSVWAYRRDGALGDAIFQSSRVINKSGVVLDSVFLVQWADPDVGNGNDDLVGCDTSLGLGYAYNGYAVDSYFGSTPPAVGFLLLQGPMVGGTPSDTALYGFARRPGYRNLPMSSFVFFTQGGSGDIADPEQGMGSRGYLQWHRMMMGLSPGLGRPFINSKTGDTTRFVFSGDPVAGTGWNDGTDLHPNDRRLCMVTGPFTMAAGDTQEIAVACYAARGQDRRASIAILKSEAGIFRQMYNSLSSGAALPPLTRVLTQNGDHPSLTFRADARGCAVAGIILQLRSYDGVLVSSIPLADDGNHQDGEASDSVFGGSVQMAPLTRGLYADAVISYRNGSVISWTHIADHLTTTDLTVSSFAVASDNINSDDVPNPGENVRYTVTLRNASSANLSHVVISASPEYTGHQLQVGSLDGNTTHSRMYDPGNPGTYLAFDVPSWYADSTISIALTIADSSEDIWRDTLKFTVKPLRSIVHTSPLQHVAGVAAGDFSIAIVDSFQVKNHLYVIRGTAHLGLAGGYSVKDSTTGTVLLDDHPLPDALGHTSPVIDGFKVLIGTVDIRPGMHSWEIPSGIRRFSPLGGYPGMGLEGFASLADPMTYDTSLGTMGMAGHLTFGGISTTLGPPDYHDVLLKLASVDNVTRWDPRVTPTDENYSRAYRYLGLADQLPADSSFAPWIISTSGGFPYQGFDYSVPFSAWDVNTDPPTRLAVGCMENNGAGGLVDGLYWPGPTTGDNSVAREFAFIFKSPYSLTPDPALAVNLHNNASTPIMWVMACSRRVDGPWVTGDQFRIIANHMPTPADLWTFNPTIVTGVTETVMPSSFELSQNFPNPFNPSTQVRYTLAAARNVNLTVYDVLGRQVAVIVNELKARGTHEVTFDGRGLASGVYFCRLQAGNFVQTVKLMLLR